MLKYASDCVDLGNLLEDRVGWENKDELGLGCERKAYVEEVVVVVLRRACEVRAAATLDAILKLAREGIACSLREGTTKYKIDQKIGNQRYILRNQRIQTSLQREQALIFFI